MSEFMTEAVPVAPPAGLVSKDEVRGFLLWFPFKDCLNIFLLTHTIKLSIFRGCNGIANSKLQGDLCGRSTSTSSRLYQPTEDASKASVKIWSLQLRACSRTCLKVCCTALLPAMPPFGCCDKQLYQRCCGCFMIGTAFDWWPGDWASHLKVGRNVLNWRSRAWPGIPDAQEVPVSNVTGEILKRFRHTL